MHSPTGAAQQIAEQRILVENLTLSACHEDPYKRGYRAQLSFNLNIIIQGPLFLIRIALQFPKQQQRH